ncbi:MAG: ferredoxin [Patescibacteria group bacterium]|nr:ferredoxin [Patescibacteria group bacterium]
MDNQNLFDPKKPSGPIKTKGYTVYVDRSLCIGAATCITVSEKTFALDNEAKAVILKTADSEKIETIIEAAKACPVSAIIIEDESGNRIFPK